MVRASDRVKMDSCAFGLKMHGVTEEEGEAELLEILREATGIAREDTRVVATAKCNGHGE